MLTPNETIVTQKQTDHAFRKRFNLILKLNNSINYNIAEKLMGHSVNIPLDNSYLPISDPRVKEKMFTEFKKAIPELIVDGTRTKAGRVRPGKQRQNRTTKEG